MIHQLFNMTDTEKIYKQYQNPEGHFIINFNYYKLDHTQLKFSENHSLLNFTVLNNIGDEEEAETYSIAEGYIKWDGCMQIDLSEHFCGWSRIFEYIMRDIYLGAATIMDIDDLQSYGDLNQLYKYYGISK